MGNSLMNKKSNSLKKSANVLIRVCAMGINDGSTDFKKVFRDMGFDDRFILTPSNQASEIRKAFTLFSQSAVKATQGATLGGFMSP